MNPGLVVKLRPAGPWRIGPDSGARNRVDAIYHSDSLYSAVTSAMSRMGSLSAWLDATARSQTPAVCFSSCFPFLDDIGFVVPPRTIWPPTSPQAMSARVRWKSARFIPLSVVESILSGKKLNENQWSVDGASGCLVPAGKAGPFRTSVRWNAAVDRLSGSSERHATACIEFREGCGLWTVAGFRDEAARDEWQDRVKAAFRLLADTGFGGERSRGWGRSETPEFVEGTLPGLVIEYRRKEPPPAVEEPPVEEPPVKEAPMVEPPPAEEPLPESEPPVEAESVAPAPEAPAEPAPAVEVAAPDTLPPAERAPEAGAAAPAGEAESPAPAVEAPAPETVPPAEAVPEAEAAAPETEPAADLAPEAEGAAPPVAAATVRERFTTEPETVPVVEAAPEAEAAARPLPTPAVYPGRGSDGCAPETEPAADFAPEAGVAAPGAEAAVLETEPVAEPAPEAASLETEPVAAPAPEAAVPETEPAAEPAPEAAMPETVPVVEAAPEAEGAPIGDAAVGSPEEMSPQAGVGRLKPAPPLKADESSVVAQAGYPLGPPPDFTAPETEPVAEFAPEPEAAPIVAAVRAPDRTEAMRMAPEREAAPAVPASSVRLQAHWLLSLYTPAVDDAVDWGRGSYAVLARGGRIDSPSGSGELKKQIQMVAEGSVLFSDGVPLGAAPDVAPDGFAHPVFRAGFALAIPVPEVH